MGDAERLIEQVDRQLNRQSSSLDRMADSMTELAKTVARSEEKHQSTDARLNAHSDKLGDHEKRIREVEGVSKNNSSFNGGAAKAIWGAIFAVFAAIGAYLSKGGN